MPAPVASLVVTPGGYGVQYVRVLDWQRAEATLTNVDASIGNLSRSVPATVDGLAGRAATIALAPIRPAGGYTLKLDLWRRDAAGVDRIVATGTRTGLTLAAGLNTVSVTLSPTSSGHVAVNAPDPRVILMGVLAGTTAAAAGTGTAGSADGPLASATLNGPTGLAIGASGQIFVADSGGSRIRRVDPSLDPTDASYMTTLAGSGSSGLVDGTAAAARFGVPGAMVRVGSVLYVTDLTQHAVRKINLALPPTDASFVTTVAGSGTPGHVDGTASAARFRNPRGLAADAAGRLYVADSDNHVVRRIDLTKPPTDAGFVTTFAGSGGSGAANGTGTGATFHSPTAIAHRGGELFVAQAGAGAPIRKVTVAGAVVTTVAGGTSGYADGAASAARFDGPRGLAVVGNAIFVGDQNNHRVRKIDLSLPPTDANFVTTVAGGSAGYAEGQGAAASFNAPMDLAVDGQGRLYVSDHNNNRVRRVQ